MRETILAAMRETILAYLCVLRSGIQAHEDLALLGQLSPEEERIGWENVAGCISRLANALATSPEYPDNRQIYDSLLDSISTREVINGIKPYGDPELVKHTMICHEMLYDFLRSKRWSDRPLSNEEIESRPAPEADTYEQHSNRWDKFVEEARQKGHQ